jgi:hypothetical protein
LKEEIRKKGWLEIPGIYRLRQIGVEGAIIIKKILKI